MSKGFQKLTTVILSASILLSLTGCSRNTDVSESSAASSSGAASAPSSLANHMTAKELERSGETEFMLFDKPWEKTVPGTGDGQYDYLKNAAAYEVWSHQDYIDDARENAGAYGSEEELQKHIDEISKNPSGYDNVVNGFVVNGVPGFYIIPPADYDGGAGKLDVLHYDPETYESSTVTIEFSDYDDLKTKLKADFDGASELDSTEKDRRYNDSVRLLDAIIGGSVIRLERGTMEKYMNYYAEHSKDLLPAADSMYWRFDEQAMMSVKDNIREYHIYDEELDRTFIIHVMTPPDHDNSVVCRALVMNDAVWRVDDLPGLYKLMEEGKAEPAIIVTIGQDYTLDNWDNAVRADILCIHMQEFLNFITDNLMPYLSDVYKLDCEHSCLFGHSQAGVFTHYAAFHADQYENQPFGDYIIASPAFWTPYFVDQDNFEQAKNDYGYFDSNTTLKKRLILVGGANEDPDYADYYGSNDSTLQGLLHLKERLDAHGVKSYAYKLYDSNHYMYVGDMLKEYLEGKLI